MMHKINAILLRRHLGYHTTCGEAGRPRSTTRGGRAGREGCARRRPWRCVAQEDRWREEDMHHWGWHARVKQLAAGLVGLGLGLG